MKVSIGICAYNEEANIGKLLDRLAREPLLNEIWVIADGCTDGTVAIVDRFNRDHNVRLATRPERHGKADAVNLYLQLARGDILILESADTLPSQFCFKYLLEPFSDETVGMVGAHPIPVDSIRTRMGKVAHLLWRAHHEMALMSPKAGEVCAFRNVVRSIDPVTPVDEASIEQQIVGAGYRVVYAPRALVFNKGAGTVRDFVRQRKRIYHGHLMLRMSGYEVPSMRLVTIAKATLRAAGYRHFRTIALSALLEQYARRRAGREYNLGSYKPTVWEMADTTKEVE